MIERHHTAKNNRLMPTLRKPQAMVDLRKYKEIDKAQNVHE